MKYTVTSGDFKTVIDRNTPREAAQDALNLWRLKPKKPDLAKILIVVSPEKKETYLSTIELMKANP